MTEAARVSPREGEEGDSYMAQLVCQNCGKERELRVEHNEHLRDDAADIIRGVLTCFACNQRTPFGMRNNAINFYPAGELGTFTPNVPTLVKEMWADAELCLYGAGFRGAVAMARATVEEALEQSGFKGRLEDQITAAKAKGALTDREAMLAHGSRLAGNDALHREASLDISIVPTALGAAVQIANHLFP